MDVDKSLRRAFQKLAESAGQRDMVLTEHSARQRVAMIALILADVTEAAALLSKALGPEMRAADREARRERAA